MNAPTSPTAAAPSWKPALAVGLNRMDATHRGFVDRLDALAALAGGPPLAALPLLEDLVAHTEAHFAQEERWIDALGFEPGGCHQAQHAGVLQVLRELLRRLRAEGDALDPELLGRLAPALAEWLEVHVPMLDAPLAQVMAERGFDPDAVGAMPEAAGAADDPPMIARCDLACPPR